MVKKEKKKKQNDITQVCSKCEKEIDLKKEKYILLGTYNGLKATQENWFHMHCFKEWYDQKVQEKAKNIVQSMQKKAMGLMQGLQGIMGNVQGFDQLGSILNIDLDKKDGKGKK